MPPIETRNHPQAILRRQRSGLLFDQGLEAESDGDMNKATALYREATEYDPSNARAWVNLGTILLSKKDWIPSEACYRKAIAIDPEFALAHFDLATLFDERGDCRGAVKYYERALAIDPQYGEAHYNIALAYGVLGKDRKALNHWRLYLKCDQDSHWAKVAQRNVERLTRKLENAS